MHVIKLLNIFLAIKHKLDNTTESYDLMPFMTNPIAKMLNNISKFVCVSLFFIPNVKKQFIPN